MEDASSNLGPEGEQSTFQSWGNVTNPSKHDPSKFRYLVHAINPTAMIHQAQLGAIMSQRDPYSINKDEGDQTINMFLSPERLSERVTLSCSLIDQKHYATWGEAGLIVETPHENVLITGVCDLGALGASKKHLEEQASRHRLLTAEELLQNTGLYTYNEVVVLANKDGKKVRLVGFFYQATEDGAPKSESVANKMRIHAQRLNLPFIPITQPNPYKENKIILDENRFQVQFKGKSYVLRGTPDWRFTSYTQSGLWVFVSPDEIQQVFDFLRANKIDQKIIEQLQSEYAEIDKERHKPEVEYDENGNIKRIEKKNGYGVNEEQIAISGNGGYTQRYNIVQMRNKLQSSMAEEKSYNNWAALSPTEVEAIVSKVIEDASEEEIKKIIQWYQENKGDIIKNWQQ